MSVARLIPVTDRNLILTGYTGPTQLAIGRRVAALLDMPSVNIDTQIEERNEMPIEEIRERFGETRLKMMEAEVVQETLLRRRSVIRVSGRTLLQGNYYERFLETGPVICLVASLDSVLANLHLALGARYHDPNERALTLGQLQQEWGVRRLSGIHEVDITYLAQEDIAAQVIELWRQMVL